jgi:hypothetical protein
MSEHPFPPPRRLTPPPAQPQPRVGFKASVVIGVLIGINLLLLIGVLT